MDTQDIKRGANSLNWVHQKNDSVLFMKKTMTLQQFFRQGWVICGVVLLTLILILLPWHRICNPGLYKNGIIEPEQLNITPAFTRQAEKGKAEMKESSIVICALGRNISDVFESNREKLERIGSMFKTYKIVLFENDSTDDSRDLFQEWEKANPHVILLQCFDESGSRECKYKSKSAYADGSLHPNRFHRMVYYRNQYLNYVKNRLPNYDYMMVFDLDLKGGISLDGIAHSFDPSVLPKWDMVCASGYKMSPWVFMGGRRLYDGLAYVPYEKGFYEPVSLISLILSMNRTCDKRIGSDLVPIYSGFNGLAIYKIQAIMKANYSAPRCEHLGLHRDMIRQGKKLFMSPSMVMYIDSVGPTMDTLDINFLQIIFGTLPN